MNLKNFLYYSTLMSIFTEALRYNIGFDLKFFYLIVFFNTIVFIVFNRLKYNKGLLIFHLIILFTGLITSFIWYNDLNYFLVQFFFLLLIPIFYFSFYVYFKDRFNDIVFFYCKACVLLAIIGFIKLPYDIKTGQAFHSIMLEPAHYCTIVLPAFFICLRNKQFPRFYYIIILISIILSGSSLGFIGLGLSIILFANKISVIKVFFASILVFFLGITIYSFYAPFKLRFDDTVNGVVSRDLSTANLSTYALLSNVYVSIESFMSNPLIGNGVGSHIRSRSLYLGDIEGIEVFEKNEMVNLNAQDAGSLFSRLMSEMGLVGIIGVFYFISRFYVSNKDNINMSSNVVVSRAILLYFFAKLFREGHYFSPEMYFFVFLYVFNKYNYNIRNIGGLNIINVK